MSEAFIHPSATVAPSCIIGNGTRVWVNAQIRENASIGENCIISKDTYIDHDVSIGNDVKIQNGVSVFNGVTIENKVFIGPNVAFTNDFYPRAFHEDWKVTATLVKTGASIGANATIVCGVTIGLYAMVGAGSVVTRDVPDYTLVVGNPARIVGYICTCGHPLDNTMNCSECGQLQVIELGGMDK